MSTWIQIKKEDIEIDRDEVNIALDPDEGGSQYATVKIKDLEDILGMIKPAKLIVDLYECRAQLIRPLNLREVQDVHEVHKYNWLNALIAQLEEKYKVKYQSVDDELKQRSRDRMADELIKRINEKP
jgi:hypothetical protein